MHLFKRLARGARSLFWAVFDGIGGIFFRSPAQVLPEPSAVKSILVIRRDALGDMVLSTPALRALRQTFTSAQIYLFASGYTRDLVANDPDIDHLILDADGMLKNTYDIAVVLHPGFAVNHLAYKSKARIRLGYTGSGGSFFLNLKVPDDRAHRLRHEVESALEVVARLGCKAVDTRLHVSVSREGEAFAEQFFRQHNLAGVTVVAMHPGARQQYIRWKPEGFSEVARRLIAEKKVRVVLVGSRGEQDLVLKVAGRLPGTIVQAVGLSVAELVSVLKRCRIFIGNSTGPMHIAAGLGVPVVALFGSKHPLDSVQAWRPWGVSSVVITKELGCPGCHPGDCWHHACMKAIGADEVFAAACKLLDDADAKL